MADATPFKPTMFFGAAIAMDDAHDMRLTLFHVGRTYTVPAENMEAFFDDLLASRVWLPAERTLFVTMREMARLAVAAIDQLASVAQ